MFTTPTQITIGEDPMQHRTVLEIIAGDRPGLLSEIGKVFLAEQIDVNTAQDHDASASVPRTSSTSPTPRAGRCRPTRANVCAKASPRRSTARPRSTPRRVSRSTAADDPHEPAARPAPGLPLRAAATRCWRAPARRACRTFRCRSASRNTRHPPSSARPRATRGRIARHLPADLGLPACARPSRAGSSALRTARRHRSAPTTWCCRSTARARRCSRSCRRWSTRRRRRATVVVMPNPFYQIYEGAALLAGADRTSSNCTAATASCRTSTRSTRHLGALPGAVPLLARQPDRRGDARSVPARALELSARYGFIIASDECYSELYFDESAPPPGLLQAAPRCGQHDFRSLRGLPQPVEALERARPALGLRRRRCRGSGAVPPVPHLSRLRGAACTRQLASVPAWHDEAARRRQPSPVPREVRSASRRSSPSAAAGSTSRRRLLPVAARRRRRGSSRAACSSEQHVTVLPGRYLARDTTAGNPGRGRVRISLVASVTTVTPPHAASPGSPQRELAVNVKLHPNNQERQCPTRTRLSEPRPS